MTKSDHKVFYYSYFTLSVILWLTYFILTFTAPINEATLARFNINGAQQKVLLISIVFPYMGIWIAGLYSILGLKKYLSLIKGSKEYKGLSLINFGLCILVLGLVLGSAISSLRPFFTPNITSDVFTWMANADVIRLITIISNYMSVLTSLSSSILFLTGAWSLLKNTGATEHIKYRIFFPVSTWLLASSAYIVLFFFNPIRVTADQAIYPNLRPTYFLPDLITIPTIVMPFIISWAIGFLAAVCLEAYRDNVQGGIYRGALGKFVNGFIMIIITSVSFQIVSTIGYQFRDINLNAILMLIYTLLTILAIGYVFMALGARKLRKIETV